MEIINPYVLAAMSVTLPFITAVLINKDWPKRTKEAVVIILSIGFAVLGSAIDNNFDIKTIASSFTIILAASQTIYFKIIKEYFPEFYNNLEANIGNK